MQSLDDLKKELTEWIDGRIDEAIDRGNEDLLKDLDTRFALLGTAVNDTAKNVAAVSDSVTKLIQSVIAIPQGILDEMQKFNPFHLP